MWHLGSRTCPLCYRCESSFHELTTSWQGTNRPQDATEHLDNIRRANFPGGTQGIERFACGESYLERVLEGNRIQGWFGLQHDRAVSLWWGDCDGSPTLLLCYVDDLLIASSTDKAFHRVFKELSKHVKVRETGRIALGKDGGGSLKFLGRVISRRASSPSLVMQVDPSYMDAACEEFGIKVPKGVVGPPDIKPSLEATSEESPISPEAHSRYRRVCLVDLRGWRRPAWTFCTIPHCWHLAKQSRSQVMKRLCVRCWGLLSLTIMWDNISRLRIGKRTCWWVHRSSCILMPLSRPCGSCRGGVSVVRSWCIRLLQSSVSAGSRLLWASARVKLKFTRFSQGCRSQSGYPEPWLSYSGVWTSGKTSHLWSTWKRESVLWTSSSEQVHFQESSF